MGLYQAPFSSKRLDDHLLKQKEEEIKLSKLKVDIILEFPNHLRASLPGQGEIHLDPQRKKHLAQSHDAKQNP